MPFFKYHFADERLSESSTQKFRTIEKQALSPLISERLTVTLDIIFLYNSNRLHESPITLQETEALSLELKEKKKVSVAQKNAKYGEAVVKQFLAWDFAKTYVKMPTSEMTFQHMIDIHSRVEPSAQLRSKSKDRIWIENVCTLLPAPFEVDALVARLFAWFHDAINAKVDHIVDIIITFHARFTRIRPFTDGNGRTVRIFTAIILMQNRLPPIAMNNVERPTYISALHAWDNGYRKPFGDLMWAELDSVLDMSLDCAEGKLPPSLIEEGTKGASD